MSAKPTRTRPHFNSRQNAVFILFTLLFLGACNQTDNTPDVTPSLPDTTGSALILGEAQSPFLDSLGKRLTLTPYDGSQNLADYDVLVFDGDYHTPDEVHDHEIVKQAVRSGMWVVGLALTEAHKRQGLGDYLQAASSGNSPAYAVHIGQDTNGRPEVRILELPVGEQEGRPVSRELGGKAFTTVKVQKGAPADSEASAAAFGDMLLGHLATPISAMQTTNIPPELLYATYYYSQKVPWKLTDAGRKKGTQTPWYQVDYTFTIFLDNGTVPQGDFQFVLAEAEMTANPKGNGDFLNMNAKAGSDWDPGTYVEMAWFQTYAHIDIAPVTAQGWTMTSNSPPTVNGTTNVTSSSSFNIGFNTAQGIFGSYTFGSSVTHPIQDWKVTNDSSGVKASWDYSSAYPLDGLGDYSCADQPMFSQHSCYIVKKPNDLSLDTLTLDTKGVWQTSKVVDDSVSFALSSQHAMADVWCANDDGFFCDSKPIIGKEGNLSAVVVQEKSTNFSINLGAVVPIPIKSITFDPPATTTQPAPADKPVTGTVTLDSPAQVDTPITLEVVSQNVNASVSTPITVKQGQQTVDFKINTNANGLKSGDTTTVTLNAFYAEKRAVQFTIQAP